MCERRISWLICASILLVTHKSVLHSQGYESKESAKKSQYYCDRVPV